MTDTIHQQNLKTLIDQLITLTRDVDSFLTTTGLEDYVSTTGMEMVREELEFHYKEETVN